jgi:hypothetical protein
MTLLNLLFGESGKGGTWREELGPRGAVVLRSFAMLNEAAIFSRLQSVIAEAPFCHK